MTIGNVHLTGGQIKAWVHDQGAVNLLELAGPPTAPDATQASAAAPAPATASAASTSSASAAASAAPETHSPPASPPSSAPPAAPAAPPAASTSPAPPATPPTSSPDAAPWTVSVPDILVEGFNISAEDRQVTPTVGLQLDALNIHATGFTTAKTTPLAVSVTSQVNHDGQLNVKADLTPDLAAMKVQAELTKLDLTVLQPYIAQRTSMTLRSGLFSTKLNVDRGANGQLTVTGDAELAKLRTIDNALKKDFIKFERLQVAGINYQTNAVPTKPASLKIRSVVANAPYARVIIESDRSVNVSRVLRGPNEPPPPTTPQQVAQSTAPVGSGTATLSLPSGSATASASSAAQVTAGPSDASATVPQSATTPQASATAPQASATTPQASAPPTEASSPTAAHPDSKGSSKGGSGKHHGSKPAATPSSSDNSMAIAIDSIRIQDGSANYADFWIQPNFAVGIQSLNGTIVGLSSSPRARAKVELNGKVDRYAPVHIWGTMNPLAATAFTDIKMNFKGMELTSVTPYSGHFAGYKIEKGKLSVDIGYKIENRQLNAEHRFVIDQLELGDRVESPDAIHLPLKIAIALLKDRNGVIDINLPVTGSLDDPQFRLGPLIWKAVLGLLTKIATAPFALLGHLFGGSEQMNFIDFRPGSAQLESAEQEKLGSLVKALKEKSQLELDVPVAYLPDLDKPGLAAAQLQRQLLHLQHEQVAGHKHGKAAASTTASTGASTPAGTTASASATGSPGAPASAAAPGSPASTPSTADNSSEDAPPDPALTDPAQHFHLLAALYRAQQGKDTVLPDAALAAETAEKKKTPPDFAAANTELETALLQKMQVTDTDLESLGNKRAHAIQDALLGGGEIDASRVFIIGSDSKPATADKDKVRVELALK